MSNTINSKRLLLTEGDIGKLNTIMQIARNNGMPITLSVAIKPTPSISKEQRTINVKTKENVKINIQGRHDACIVPRAVAPVESAVAIAILDSIISEA